MTIFHIIGFAFMAVLYAMLSLIITARKADRAIERMRKK